MKVTTILLALVSSAVAGELKACRATCKGPQNQCQVGVGGTDGLNPPLASRLADCSSLNIVTVTPVPVTSTQYQETATVDVPGTSYIKKKWKRTSVDLETLEVITTTAAAAAVTVQPTVTPSYATYCENASKYFSACKCAGATPVTTYAPTPTVTEISEFPVCAKKMLMRRAREGIANLAGYI